MILLHLNPVSKNKKEKEERKRIFFFIELQEIERGRLL
jgi:hypothetical protein